MKKILLVNVDSKIKNLALCKIREYYTNKGNIVTETKDNSNTLPIFVDEFDKIYVSCVFDWNKHKCKKWEGIAQIGGSGYSLEINLPPEIEKLRPKLNFGFCTRGCPRNCQWCIVPQKEGKAYIEGDIYDMWNGKSKEITIMDNNTLALPKHFFKIAAQLKKEKLRVDFNQGLDFRLLTPEIIKELFSLSFFREIRFSFDHLSYKPMVIKALDKLRKGGLKDWQTRWYVYVGTYDTLDTVLERVNLIRSYKQLVYLMRDRAVIKKAIYKRALLEWCNYPGLFKNSEFKPNLSENKRLHNFHKEQRQNKLGVFEK